MMVEQNPDPAAKRQRLEAEQRIAFEEDMARVRAAMGSQNESARTSHAGESTSEQGSHEQCPASNSRDETRADSDDEDGGNWLKNFTTHHTRVGEKYQVTDLPIPSSKK